jgi:hypothetical protein
MDIKKAYNPDSGSHRRQGNTYLLTPEEVALYREQGYIILNDVLTDEEVATLDPWFDHFVT